MKKKVLIIAIILTVFCTFSISAISLGPELGFVGTTNYGESIGVSLRLDQPNLIFSLYPSFGRYYYGNSYYYRNWVSLSAAVDYWFMNPKIADIAEDVSVNWFLGAGGMASVYFYYYSNSSTYIEGEIGARMPVGINFMILNWIEPYIQIAPTVGLAIHSEDSYYYYNNSTRFGVMWQIPLALGCRFKL